MFQNQAALAGSICMILALAAGPADAYDRYKNPATESGNCSTCHGDFTDNVSTKGSVFPGGDKHQMHRSNSNMNADCDLCHAGGDQDNPWIGSSDGTATNPGLGCGGCHGRVEDQGHDGISPGTGAGLRQHHMRSGVTECLICHSDSDPMSYTPVGEHVSPVYYGTVDTNVDNSCNPPGAGTGVNENWTIGDRIGDDQDGDLLEGVFDPDCRPGPAVSFSGTCPGVVNVVITGATPGGNVAAVQGTGLGAFTNPSAPCAGLNLDMTGPSLVQTLTADASGNVTLSPSLPAGFCGELFQIVDITTCQAGNLAFMP